MSGMYDPTMIRSDHACLVRHGPTRGPRAKATRASVRRFSGRRPSKLRPYPIRTIHAT